MLGLTQNNLVLNIQDLLPIQDDAEQGYFSRWTGSGFDLGKEPIHRAIIDMLATDFVISIISEWNGVPFLNHDYRLTTEQAGELEYFYAKAVTDALAPVNFLPIASTSASEWYMVKDRALESVERFYLYFRELVQTRLFLIADDKSQRIENPALDKDTGRLWFDLVNRAGGFQTVCRHTFLGSAP
jgi:hypothetical protein